jgi:hypothetical protein
MSESDQAIKDSVYTIKIAVYGRGNDTSQSHGFCVDDFTPVTSPPIGEVLINVHTTTFEMLRDIIQYSRNSHINKRSMMFQEALFIMDRLPNFYNRPDRDLNKYLFGFSQRETKELTIVPSEHESSSIVSLVGIIDFSKYDILLIPLSQLPP